MTKEERFKKIVSEQIKRPGIEKLMEWLQSSDFYTAPASTRFMATIQEDFWSIL